jgi:hypothetical protein
VAGQGHFAPGNAGVPFLMDVICPVLSIALLMAAWPYHREEQISTAVLVHQFL